MAETKRRLAAILSADVVGYSRLMQDDEAATVETLTKYRNVFSDFVMRHDGRVVDSPGDNILAEFDSPVEAVQCAIEIQRELGRRNRQLADHRQMHFRIGINLGDVLHRDDGTLYGDGVNIAARLESLAKPGGVMISDSARMQVRTLIDVGIADAGEHEVKNIAEPVHAYQIVLDAPVAAAAPGRLSAILRRPAIAAAVGALVVAVGVLAAWFAVRAPAPTPETTTSADPVPALPPGPSIAVLPFTNLSGDPEQEYFVDGLTEEIIAQLTRFKSLFVIARNSTFQYKGRSADVREVGRELGVRYVVEGSVRKSAETIRVTAQLLDGTTGAHLWAESYEQDLDTVNLFDVQDNITQQIVATLADSYGVITHASLQEAKRSGTESLEVYECILRDNEFRRAQTPDTHIVARSCLEKMVELDPDYAEAWARLSHAYVHEFAQGFNPRPEMYDALERGYQAAKRAAELEPSNEWVRLSLARAHFFRREPDLFLIEAERAVELNLNNADVIGTIGNYVAYAGKWERGLALLEKAMALSPYYPGWYTITFVEDHYRKGEYEKALALAHQINMPNYWWTYMDFAMVYGQLGRADEARAAAERMRELYPGFAADPRAELRKWYYSEELVEHFLDGLRKAGLEIANAPPAE